MNKLAQLKQIQHYVEILNNQVQLKQLLIVQMLSIK